MIRVTDAITIREEEIHQEFIRASGPGGQNVNKVATAVQLRFDVAHSPSLPEDVRERLTRLAGKRMSKEGYLIIDARRFRTQEQNRQDSVARGWGGWGTLFISFSYALASISLIAIATPVVPTPT
jgi:ribosome-associated protein